MKVRSAIRELGLTASHKKTRKKVCGLWSLPDEVVLSCLAHVSRLDLAAFDMASKAHRSLLKSSDLWDLRWEIGSIEPFLYVCLHIIPEPTPRWFILHAVKRRLKPIHPPISYDAQAPESSSSFVVMHCGVYIIGGLVNGKPTPDVSLFDCSTHTWYRLPPMKMARASASASLIEGRLYVFGGCGDDADPSNWAEVYDALNRTWDFLSVSTAPLSIQQSVVIDVDDKDEVYAVDEDGQSFSFSPSKRVFVASGKTDCNPGFRDDWCLIEGHLFCRGDRGRILWCLPDELDWKEVKQGSTSGWSQYDITKLCRNDAGNLVIFWNAQPEGPESFELWSAEISLETSEGSEGFHVWGNIDWSGAVFKLDPHSYSDSVRVLFAGFIYA